jgi:hypothetical protein
LGGHLKRLIRALETGCAASIAGDEQFDEFTRAVDSDKFLRSHSCHVGAQEFLRTSEMRHDSLSCPRCAVGKAM